MKPKIKKTYSGRYECLIPEDQVPDNDTATELDWYNYLAVGIGSTPKGAYSDWLKDCLPSEGTGDGE